MRKTVLLAAIVALAVTFSASSAYASQPAWGVRLGSQMFYQSIGIFGVTDGYPDFDYGTVYWSREVPVPYPFDAYHLIKEVFFRGHVTTNHLVVLEWFQGEQYGGSSTVWYLDPEIDGSLTSKYLVGTAWNVGTFRIGILCKPGTLDEGWVYVDHVRCGADVDVYFTAPDWYGGDIPVPEPPDPPEPINPGTVPPISYPTLPDGGSTPAPGGLPQPGDGGISPLPDTQLDPPADDFDPIPDPDDAPDPADPVPDPDDLPGPADPVPDPDEVPVADPIPDADELPEADPLPVADDVPMADPLLVADEAPAADDVADPDPLPVADDIPQADLVPELDPILTPDDPPTPDPVPLIDPLPGGA